MVAWLNPRLTASLALLLSCTQAACGGGSSDGSAGAEGSESSGSSTSGAPAVTDETTAATADGTTTAATTDASGSEGSTGDTTGETGEPPGVDWDAAFDHVFPQDHVIAVTLDPAPGVWEALLAEWDQSSTKSYYASAMTFDGEAIPSVGFRLKGWSSLAYGSGLGGGPIQGGSQPGGKFPLKVDFDRFGGPRFHEVGKINFGNNWADLSYMRERLANRLYDAMGVPAPRTAYARVSVDGHDNGVYTAVQQIDRCFLEEHFGLENGNGNLYKAIFTSTDIGALTYQGATRNDYFSTTTCPANFPECGLVQKTNEDDPALNDYADLVHFLDVLNHSADAEFESAIVEVFDVDAFLRLAAVSVVTSSFDGYLGMGHNYYLYHRPDTDQFIMIPWDQNESHAGHPCGANAISFSIEQAVCNQRGHDFVLARRVLGVPSFHAQYLVYVQQLVDDYFTEAQYSAWIAELGDLVRPQIETDSNYIQDLTIFDRSLGYDAPAGPNLGGHGGTEYNLMYFVSQRRMAVLSQL